MTHLRKMMLEELQRRNYSEATTRCYIRTVEDFSRRFNVLHSWTQKLELHPHVHCVVPAGGLSADHTHWIKPRYDFFFPSRCSALSFAANSTKRSRVPFMTASSIFMET
jgi:Putative transposase